MSGEHNGWSTSKFQNCKRSVVLERMSEDRSRVFSFFLKAVVKIIVGFKDVA